MSGKLKTDSGFTLIEMAIVMVIIGIIISVMSTVLPNLIHSGKIKKTQSTLEKVDYSLQGYIVAAGRLPCPDTNGDGRENRNDNEWIGDPSDDTCPSYVGDLPYITLGLSIGTDVWGNKIKYGVYADLIQTTTSTGKNPLCGEIKKIIKNQIESPDTTKLYTTAPNGDNPVNKAYVIVSGGHNDLDGDGADGLYDGFNEGGDLHFDAPDRMIFHGNPSSIRYDDLVRAASISYIGGSGGCGSATGGNGSSGDENGGEHTYPDGCKNNKDDDGDGFEDCDDQDCYGVEDCPSGGSNVGITTSSLPDAYVGASYSSVLKAIGGVTPYEWTLTSDGGLTGLGLHPYEARLSGGLDHCPGVYTISVQVEDSKAAADGGPGIDTKDLSINVLSNLSVSRTSGSGIDITWSLSSQKETFQTFGGHVGDINWSLNSGGATGFSISPTGTDTCVVKKTGTTTPGTYSFTITATDDTCPDNTARLLVSVIVEAAASGIPGDITGIVDALEFDTSTGLEPEIIPISGSIYAIVYRGPGSDGWLKTVEIDDDGNIANSQIDSLEWDTVYAPFPQIIPVSGDVYAIAYTGPGNDGFLKTVQISSDGQIGNTVIDTLEFETNFAYVPDIVHVAGSYFAIGYRGPGNDGWLKTVEIAGSGMITNTVVDALEFNTSYGLDPDLFHIGGSIFAIAYTGPGADGWLKTIEIDTNGQIVNPSIDTLEFDGSYGLRPHMVHVTGEIYALAYRGNGADGWMKTVVIAANGQMDDSPVDSFEFDTSYGIEPDIVQIGGDIFAVAYSGPGNDGWLKTVEINSSGQITDTAIEALEFDTSYCNWPSIIHVTGNVFAVAYRGPGNDGWLKTIGISR